MPKGSDWILAAAHTDPSLMRDVLADRTARRLGHYASRTRYVTLRLDGHGRGVYILMEQLRRDRGRVDSDALLELTSAAKLDRGDRAFGLPATGLVVRVADVSKKAGTADVGAARAGLRAHALRRRAVARAARCPRRRRLRPGPGALQEPGRLPEQHLRPPWPGPPASHGSGLGLRPLGGQRLGRRVRVGRGLAADRSSLGRAPLPGTRLRGGHAGALDAAPPRWARGGSAGRRGARRAHAARARGGQSPALARSSDGRSSRASRSSPPMPPRSARSAAGSRSVPRGWTTALPTLRPPA